MEEMSGKEARRWLSRQLVWEKSLDRLVRAWETEQGVPESASSKRRPLVRSRPPRAGLPVQKPAA